MILTTLEQVPGYEVKEVLGIVSAGTVLARHIGKDILAALRNLVGGEVKEYTEVMAQARDRALERLRGKAESLGANAIIGIRFTTSAIAQNAAEVMAYGTAVVLEPK
ncbi:MAG: YbjQ family protein [Chlorobi bacterium]|nr:YbjQ family protein [Chlorobiota bacterium]